MAISKVIIFSLVLIAIVGIVFADTPTPSTSTTSNPHQVATSPLLASVNNEVIGTTDDDAVGAPSSADGRVVAGPLGNGSVEGPSSSSQRANHDSGTSILTFSTIFRIVAVVNFFAL